MRKTLLVVLLVFLCGLGVAAQDNPKAELFAGYSYLRLDFGSNPLGGDNNVPAGFDIDGTYYFAKYLGLTGDFDYHKKSWTNNPAVGTASGSFFGFHAGPRFKVRLGKIEPFGHALFGVTHASATPPGGPTETDTVFSMKLGGGLDLAIARHFAIRLAEGNYYMTKFSPGSDFNFPGDATGTAGPGHQNNFTLSAGIVIR